MLLDNYFTIMYTYKWSFNVKIEKKKNKAIKNNNVKIF